MDDSTEPKVIDETRLDNESWLDMRRRTESDRYAVESEQAANEYLVALATKMKKEILHLRKRNAELYRFARLMMKTLEETDSIAYILADWSEG